MNNKQPAIDWRQLEKPAQFLEEQMPSGEFGQITEDRALAWEDTQNQTEEIHRKNAGEPIRVVATFHKKVPRKRLEGILTKELKKLLSAANRSKNCKGIHSRIQAIGEDEIGILTLESFNQKGMTGPIYKDPYKSMYDPNRVSHWISATQAYGVTSKSNLRKGSKGRGKEANQNASEAGINIVYTVREDEEFPRVMMGVMRTCHFEMTGTANKQGLVRYHNYTPHATFGNGFDDEKGQLPILGEHIDKYAEALGFVRKPNETGVSHAIISPREDITPQGFAQHIVSRFALNVMRGDFEYVIVDESEASRLEITSDTIREIASELDWSIQTQAINGGKSTKHSKRNFAYVPGSDWEHVFDAYESLNSPDEDGWISNERIPGRDATWNWDEQLFSEESLAAARERWATEGELRVRMMVNARIAEGEYRKEKAEICDYKVVIRKKPETTYVKTNELWSRDGMVIPLQGIGFLEERETLAVVDVPLNHNLGRMIRDSEGEGHLEWVTTTMDRKKIFGPTGTWPSGHESVAFVAASVEGIWESLFPPAPQEVVEADEFSHTIAYTLPPITCEKCGKAPCECTPITCEKCGKAPCECPPPLCPDCNSRPCICIRPPPPGVEKVAQISSREGGTMRAMRNLKVGSAVVGKRIAITTAILNPRRNSFTAFSKHDYKPDDIIVSGLVDCELLGVDYANPEKSKGGVSITLEITGSDWRTDISGFPVDRDLDTKVEVIG